MPRILFAALALVFLACGGRGSAPSVSPGHTGSPLMGNSDAASYVAEADTTPDDLVQEPPVDPALLAADTAAELRVAADSMADEAVLEELADAHPADDEEEAAGKKQPEPMAAEDLANAVTWDIDVETFNDHARVQYYLDFFQGKGRERMGIWLTRMPRYEAMIRERLQREGLPGDLVYLALIESGFSNTATSRAKAVGMWQFMKATGKGYGLRVDSWVDERRDPFKATDAAVRHLRDLNR